MTTFFIIFGCILLGAIIGGISGYHIGYAHGDYYQWLDSDQHYDRRIDDDEKV